MHMVWLWTAVAGRLDRMRYTTHVSNGALDDTVMDWMRRRAGHRARWREGKKMERKCGARRKRAWRRNARTRAVDTLFRDIVL